jgi:hypothetical protein
MKQTAVEWLVEQFNTTINYTLEEYEKKVEQAKEMERQQIMTAFTQGDIFGADYFDGVNITEENYYNQTFNKPINNKG